VGISPNHFDHGKPFYPLVINYVAQLVGFKELALRGLTGGQSLNDVFSRALMPGHAPVADEAVMRELREGLAKFLGPLQLKSEFTQNHVTIDTDELARELVSNFAYLSTVLMRSAGSLLILAHEISKDSQWHDQSSLWEFLRHCRNAAAHGGCFHLEHGEPQRPAQWGTFAISAKFNKTPLFRAADGPGLLSPGDPIRLLWDIEQAFPQMHA